MDDKNQGGYNPQNVPSPPNPYSNTPNVELQPVNPAQQPGPNIYPPQYSQPAPQPNDKYEKNKKLLIIGFIAGLVVIIIGLIVALVFSGAKNEPGSPNQITKTYDSPLGILTPFQAADIKNGSFKIISDYATGVETSHEGQFYIEDNQVVFDVLKDTTKVNEFIKSLYIKQGKQADYSEQTQGATRNFKYDFTSLMGYGYLTDANLPQGFIPVVEQARDNPELAANNKALRLGRDCNAALSELRTKIGSNMTTTSLDFSFSEEGIRRKAEVSFSSRQSIDNSVIRFLENCFDQTKKEAAFYKDLTDKLRDNVTPSPVFSYWTENSKYYLEISNLDKDTVFSEGLKLELEKLNEATTDKTGETASFTERRNQFGLAYSICQVPPISITSIKEGYRFLPEDTSYEFPVSKHAGYFCDTRSVPAEFKPAANVTLRLENGLTNKIPDNKIQDLRAYHDLRYEVEKYKMENNRYPNSSEFTELADNNMGELISTSQNLLRSRLIQYRPEPNQCVGDCSKYQLTFNLAPNFRLIRNQN